MTTTELIGDGDGYAVGDPDGSFVGFGDSSPAAILTGYTFGTLGFFAVDVDIFRPGTAAISFARGWATSPWGTFSAVAASPEVTSTITASDVGYRTESPVTVYSSVLQDAFQLDARVPIDPGQVGATWAWGTIRLANDDRRYDAIVRSWNADGRNVVIYYGTKTWDDSRGLWLDPTMASLKVLFRGVAQPWAVSETDLEIPVRDGTAWLERPAQRDVYQGTGTYQGDTELTGTPIPKVRGVVFNIGGTLIDRTALIYQFTDAACSIDAIYEDGGAVFTFQADTTNLYAGTTLAGHYRTDVSRGLVQFGSEPVGTITADVTGHFPTAGAVTQAVAIALNLMLEDLLVPSTLIDTATFTAADAAYPYEAGIWVDPSSNDDGVAAVMWLLSAIGARLVPSTTGAIACLVLRRIPLTATAVAQFTTANIIVRDDGAGGVTPRQLPTAISPPPYRLRVAYQHNYTVQTGTLSGSITATQRQFVEKADRLAFWSSGAVSLAYRNANDPPPFGGALTTQADAQQVVDGFGDFLADRPLLWDVTINVADGIDRAFGDFVWIEYPNHSMESGRMFQVVGRGINATEETMTLTVIG